jgi:hypothetical protein
MAVVLRGNDMSSSKIELEEQIVRCWSVVEDIKAVHTIHQDHRELDVDEMSNVLMGLEHLYAIKFELLFDTFEKHLRALHVNESAKDEEIDVLNTKLVLLEDELKRLRDEAKIAYCKR